MAEDVARPTSENDRAGWNAYWTAQGMPWRTEPEVGQERQAYLIERRNVTPDISKGTYPFRDEAGGVKLTRADVEWLLATHESGGIVGPIVAGDLAHRWREGLDLRGCDLNREQLINLPLSRLRGGLSLQELGKGLSTEQQQAAAIHLERANLAGAELVMATLCCAHLEGATFDRSHLRQAFLVEAHAECGSFVDADLTFAKLQGTHAEDGSFSRAHLNDANMERIHLEGSSMGGADLTHAVLVDANLQGVYLGTSILSGANLHAAQCGSKAIPETDLRRIRRWQRNPKRAVFEAIQPPCYLAGSVMNETTNLDGIKLGEAKTGTAWLADVRWGEANLASVDWSHVRLVGEEYQAMQKQQYPGLGSSPERDWSTAARTYRQLARVLRNQELIEEASHYAYRSHRLQKRVFRQQKRYSSYLNSVLLDMVGGYGYKPRLLPFFGLYLSVVSMFALLYFLFAPHVDIHLTVVGAFVLSVTSFHGRGFFPGGIPLDDPITVIAAIEAFVGLVVEVSFIAAFTQRFFAR